MVRHTGTRHKPIIAHCPKYRIEGTAVTPYKCLGKISDDLHPNNQNNQLERRARPPKDVP